MKILVLDNYDSFTYNLVHMVEAMGYGSDLQVFRNDKITVSEAMEFEKILLSPGPGLPQDAGIMHDLIKAASPVKSILGVCLGHQAIASVFGGHLININPVKHGVSGPAMLNGHRDYLFEGMPEAFEVCHYHSWVVDPEHFPEVLEVQAHDGDGYVMALRHKDYDVHGLQFHPESILTQHGQDIIGNWLKN